MEYHIGSHDGRETGRIIRENPPRNINLYSKLVILFGGLIQQMGWGFFGFGMIFFWIFVMNSEARYLLSFDGEWVKTKGVLKNVTPTNSSVNDRLIYAYTFSYATKSGIKEGRCYGYFEESYRTNQTVSIEFKEANHKRARIVGMSTSTFPMAVLFVVIFPLIGLGFIIGTVIRNIKALKLLIYGNFAKGKMLHKTATGTRVNNNTVFKYTFEFEVPGGMKYQTNCSTYQTWLVEDEEMEIILYDASYPENAIVYDAVSYTPNIDPQGHLESAPISAASVFILPIISIALNVILFYIFVILGVSF